MILLCIDWSAILDSWFFINIVPKLVIGVILGLFGVSIWKWQFSYQKKVEAYTNILPYLHKMESYYQDLYNEGLFFEDKHSKKMQEEILAFLNNEYTSLTRMLMFYFGESYGTPIGEIEEMLRINAIFGWNKALKIEEKEHIKEQFKIIYSIGKELKSMGKWYNIKLF